MMPANLILLTLDCVRADSLSVARGPGGWIARLRRLLRAGSAPVPNLRSVADAGISVGRVFTTAPFTPPAHASLFTGCYPQRHGVRLLVGQQMDPEPQTLAGCLRRAGYRTAAFPGAFVLNSDTGLLRGFEHRDDVTDGNWSERGGYWRSGRQVLRAFLRWLDVEGAEGPFFAFLHLFDAHHDDQSSREQGLSWAEGYHRQLRRMDEEVIGGLVDELRHRGMLESTGFVVTADHGEGLGEHGEEGHGKMLFDATLKIPLIYAMPWLECDTPRFVDAGVSRIIDVMPTTLSLMGLEPPEGLDGLDLSAALLGKEAFPKLDAYSETCPVQLFEGDRAKVKPFMGVEKASLRTDRWRYIAKADGQQSLYEIGPDGEGAEDLADARPRAVERFARRLEELRTWEKPQHTGKPRELDEQVVQRLRDLGYL